MPNPPLPEFWSIWGDGNFPCCSVHEACRSPAVIMRDHPTDPGLLVSSCAAHALEEVVGKTPRWLNISGIGWQDEIDAGGVTIENPDPDA